MQTPDESASPPPVAALPEPPTEEQLLRALRRAHAIAREAMEGGHHPFGALLLGQDHETVLMEQRNVDSVNHAEAVLAREASRLQAPAVLWGCTLVSTVEPCAMCAGTLYWANIGRLAYGVGERRLLELLGEPTDDVAIDLGSRELFRRGRKPIEVIGPFASVEEETVALHRSWRRQR